MTCHICQKTLIVSGDLKTHLLQHEDVKPYVYSECSKRFCTASVLKRHQLVHSDIKLFYSSSCDKNFRYKNSVKMHFKRCFLVPYFVAKLSLYTLVIGSLRFADINVDH